MSEITDESGNHILSEGGDTLSTEGESAASLPALRLTWPPHGGGSYDLVTVKVGDTERPWADVIMYRGSPVDLTGAASVALRIRSVASGDVVDRDAEIAGAAAGSVRYQPVDDDLAAPDRLALNWRVLFSDGRRLTYPSRGHVYMEIEA